MPFVVLSITIACVHHDTIYIYLSFFLTLILNVYYILLLTRVPSIEDTQEDKFKAFGLVLQSALGEQEESSVHYGSIKGEVAEHTRRYVIHNLSKPSRLSLFFSRKPRLILKPLRKKGRQGIPV